MRVTGSQYAKLARKPKKARAWSTYIPKRVDKNQPEIVCALRKMGFAIKHLHEMGNGVFDLLAEKYGLNVLAEVKDGSKPPSRRGFTPAQKQFNFEWRGMRCVLTSIEDCYRLNESMYVIWCQLQANDIRLDVVGSKEKMYEPSLY